MTRTVSELQNSSRPSAARTANRHTIAQLEVIDTVFEVEDARLFAREVPVFIGEKSRAFFEEDDNGNQEIRIQHSLAVGRAAALHEFAHAYHMMKWPDLLPDKDTSRMLCEAAAIVPVCRYYFKMTQLYFTDPPKDVHLWLHRAYSTPGMTHMATRLAFETDARYPQAPIQNLMHRILVGG